MHTVEIFLVFTVFPSSFPRILGVPQRKKDPCFSGFPLLLFVGRKQGLAGQVPLPCKEGKITVIPCLNAQSAKQIARVDIAERSANRSRIAGNTELGGRAKGAAKASCGETVVQKGVFGESISSLPA